MGKARVRGTYVKMAVSCAKQLPPGLRDAVFEELGDTRAEIRAAGLLEWVPIKVHIDAMDATYRALGSVGSRDFWRGVQQSSFERPLMKPLIEAALRLYGRNPGSLLRIAPRAISTVFQDIADIRQNQEARRLEFENLAQELRESQGMVDAFTGSMTATITYLSIPGNVTPMVDELRRGRLYLEMRWQA